MSLQRKNVGHLVVDVSTVALFAGALLAPLVDQGVRPESDREPLNENRSARPEPEAPRDLAGLNAFPSAFEAHHADTFGLRDVLLRWNSVLKTRLFCESPTPTVVLDGSGWVDYGGEQTMEVWRGVHPLAEPDLDRWTSWFALAAKFCAQSGAKYLFVACPNKETVYPDHVPARYERIGPSRLDQIVARLPDALSPAFLDLRAPMSAARENESQTENFLYYQHGTHWNGRGSWVAYKAIMRSLAVDFPKLHAPTEDEIEWQISPDSGLDSWGPRLYQPDRFRESVYTCLVKGEKPWKEVGSQIERGIWHTQNPDVSGPRVLVICDSFGGSLWTLFSATFPEVEFVQSSFEPALVEGMRPDLVIELRVERSFVIPPFATQAAMAEMETAGLEPGQGKLALHLDPSQWSSLVVMGRAQVERKADGIALSSPDIRSGWELPPFEVAASDGAWLSVEIESEKPGTLLAYRREGKDGPWSRRDPAKLHYAAGRRTVVVPLAGPPGRRQVLLRLFDAPAHVIVRDLEVRTTGS